MEGREERSKREILKKGKERRKETLEGKGVGEKRKAP